MKVEPDDEADNEPAGVSSPTTETTEHVPEDLALVTMLVESKKKYNEIYYQLQKEKKMNVSLQQEKSSLEKKVKSLNDINRQLQSEKKDLEAKSQKAFELAREHSSLIKSSDMLKKHLDAIEKEQKLLKPVFAQLVINDKPNKKINPKSEKLTSSVVKRKRNTKIEDQIKDDKDETMDNAVRIEPIKNSDNQVASVVKRKRNTNILDQVEEDKDDTMGNTDHIEPTKGSNKLDASEVKRKRNSKLLKQLSDVEMGQKKRIEQSKCAENRTSDVVKRKRNAKKLGEVKGGLAKSDKQKNQEIHFEVEQILDHKMKWRKRHFFIKWQNFDNTHNSWVKEDFLNCDDILKQYLKSKNLQ